jgi:glutaredoxin-related protein
MHAMVPATPAVDAFREGWHASTVRQVAEAVGRDRVVVVGMGWNPHVRRARALLDGKKVPYTYLEFGNYLTGWKPRLALKIWAGFPTFPMVFVDGTLVGGASDLADALTDGRFDGWWAAPPAR